MRRLTCVSLTVAAALVATDGGADPLCAGRIDRVQPARGVVGDPQTAVAVARAYLEPIYGKVQIATELPLQAKLSDGVWTVTGTPSGPRFIGGLVELKMCNQNGRVLSIIHYK